MKHYHATKVFCDKILAGTKTGEIVLFNFSDLDYLDEKKVSNGTIVAIDIKNGVFAALSQNYDVIIGEILSEKIKINGVFSGLNNIVEDGYEVSRGESQGISLNSDGTKVVFRSPNSTCMMADLSDMKNIISNFRFDVLYDIVTLCWTESDNILVGFGNGVVGKINIKDGSTRTIKLDNINESVHWFERVNDSEYIVATDARCVVRLDEHNLSYKVGPKFANDDFEHVTYDYINKVAYGTSFDRKVYKIDVESLEKIEVVYEARFKIRWSDIIYKDDIPYLILQIRDGSIVKFNLSTKKVEKLRKETPSAFWTYVNYLDKDLFFGEDGGYLFTSDNKKESFDYRIKREYEGYYIKRAISDENLLVLGGTNGKVMIKDHDDDFKIINIESPVRDLCFGFNSIYVASESGCVYKIEGDNVRVIYKSKSEPVWSISFNFDLCMLAIGERIGSVRILDSLNGYHAVAYTDSRIPKRMKWIDKNKLAVVNSSNIDLITYDAEDKSWEHVSEFYKGGLNTIEDFITYNDSIIIGISYSRYILSWHLETGEVLGKLFWDQDYAKGIMNIDKGNFIVYGRNSKVKEYIMHDNDILLTKIVN
ncbi:Outer membrane protein assembly factor BamB [Photorhabdus australis subsp. thailandensis]|uniref:Outer membrane protein assembly factor BamB n=1 Tax=Photorhabdus australis subsp. thailandensis TaxID=2805096 RepID=A0A1C0TZB8_9GAMM|nr:hypothetical protein [Photorhabdus australis]OCQ51011.1 Outer membrane protein assembly factor BamB [Photorhabdus australis subsp. thailandensis]